MNFGKSELTIEGALADPMIRAVMKADRVEPRDFERLLRGAARLRETAPFPVSAVMATCGGHPGAARACFA